MVYVCYDNGAYMNTGIRGLLPHRSMQIPPLHRQAGAAGQDAVSEGPGRGAGCPRDTLRGTKRHNTEHEGPV